MSELTNEMSNPIDLYVINYLIDDDETFKVELDKDKAIDLINDMINKFHLNDEIKLYSNQDN